MAYADIATIQTIATGQPFLAATLQQIRDNDEHFADPPACSVYNSTTQSIGNASNTVLTANSENFDNDSMHSTASNTSRITIQTDGRYLFSGTVLFAANATGARSVGFLVNGTTAYIATSTTNIGGSLAMGVSGMRAIVLAAGDYVECRAYQSSGGNLDVTLTEFACFWMTR